MTAPRVSKKKKLETPHATVARLNPRLSRDDVSVLLARRDDEVGTSAKPISRRWGRTASGNVKAIFTITEEQDNALREESFRRALESGRRADASAIVREALAAWLDRRRK